MNVIANDSAGAPTMKKACGKADALRARGICPNDRQACRLSARCTLGRTDACAVLLNNAVPRCTECRRRAGRCAFACFRRDAVKGNGVPHV